MAKRHLLVVFACLIATAVHAQERLELLVGRDAERAVLELDVSADQFGTVRALTPVPRVPRDAVVGIPFVLAGGRYVAWTILDGVGGDPESLQIFDRESRTTRLLSLRGSALLADPVRPRVFSLVFPVVGSRVDDSRLFVYDIATNITRGFFPLVPSQPSVEGLTYAADVDRIVAWRFGFRLGPDFDAAVLDVASGAVLRTFPILGAPLAAFALTRDGRWLYTHYGGGVPASIVAYDVTTGLEAARSSPVLLNGRLIVDDARGLVLVPSKDRRAIGVLDGATLATRAMISIPPGGQDFAIYAEKTSPRVHVVRAGPVATGCLGVIETLAPDGTLKQTVDIAAVTGGWLPLDCTASRGVLVSASFATVTLTASVTGNTVALAWLVSSSARAMELHIGVTPDATILRLPLDVNTTSLRHSGVPPGVYYARVVTIDAAGTAASSNQVRIEVR